MESNTPPPYNPRLLRVEGAAEARAVLERLGCDTGGIAIMGRKMVHLVVAVENVQARAANIIKQVMLSKGGECATPRDLLILPGDERVSVVMMGTMTQFRAASQNLSVQPFGLKRLSVELKKILAIAAADGTRVMSAGDYDLELGGRTLVMGVVNVTPDSFSDPGRFYDFDAARDAALAMADAGADMIDIGGESTRPGAEEVGLDEELERTVPLIEAVAGRVGVPVSIDTYKAEVARRALDAGASIVNDISGLRFDAALTPLLVERGVPVIIMHMQGVPRNMQENPVYEDVVADIFRFLRERADAAVADGIAPEAIMVDPGIGFGKTVQHNLDIVRHIDAFRSLGYPVVLGTSRKRFIGSVLDKPVDQRLLGTAATMAFAVSRGVDVVRVHDVEEMVQVVRMADAVAGKWRGWE